MPKPSPSNNMPWPENLIFDFALSSSTSPDAAEKYIDSLPTSDKNKGFIRLRYMKGQSYMSRVMNIPPRKCTKTGRIEQRFRQD